MGHVAIDERDPATILMLSEENEPVIDKRYLQGVLCLETRLKYMEFGAANPNIIRTLRARVDNPEDTLKELANKIGITAPAVHQHLTAIKRELNIKNLGKKK